MEGGKVEMEFIFTTANIIFTIGTLRLFKTVIKNRSSLHDFDLIGSMLTSAALFLMVIGYLENRMIVSFVFLMPTLMFWMFVSMYSLNDFKDITTKLNKRKEQNGVK